MAVHHVRRVHIHWGAHTVVPHVQAILHVRGQVIIIFRATAGIMEQSQPRMAARHLERVPCVQRRIRDGHGHQLRAVRHIRVVMNIKRPRGVHRVP